MSKRHYFSYVLRLWKSQRQGRPFWQAELEDIHTRERRRFTLDALLVFLRDSMEEDVQRRETGREGE